MLLFLSNSLLLLQCDDNEQAYLKVLMDEIFGRDNFINIISAKMKNIATFAKTNIACKRSLGVDNILRVA
jgi:hypothetical protein